MKQHFCRIHNSSRSCVFVLSKGLSDNAHHKSFADFNHKNVRNSVKRKLVRAQARQVIEEIRVCDYTATFVDDVNQKILARAEQPFRIILRIDDSPNADNDVTLSREWRRFLSRNADPPALDFVDAVIEKLKITNKILRSFKLKIAVEEVTA